MPKISISILTKNRAELLARALASVERQSFRDYEVVVVNDGSTDETANYLQNLSEKFQIINHKISNGITVSRQAALQVSKGEYIAILDDDDEWIDKDKLKKQVEFLDNHQGYVLTGGGIQVISKQILSSKSQMNYPGASPEVSRGLKARSFAEARYPIRLRRTSSDSPHIDFPEASLGVLRRRIKLRPSSDSLIRRTMLFRNNFFTSAVMFRKEAAVRAGGFKKDEFDVAEDYDLWLRMGLLGKMQNFQEAFALYSVPNYNKERFRQFLTKQLKLINTHRQSYPYANLAAKILVFRLWLSNFNIQELKIKG